MENLSGKPRITYEPVIIRHQHKVAHWRCDGSGVTGRGAVPGLAYLDWLRAASGLRLNAQALADTADHLHWVQTFACEKQPGRKFTGLGAEGLPEPSSAWVRIANRFNWRTKP